MTSMIAARDRAGEVRTALFDETAALLRRLGIEPAPRPAQASVRDPELLGFQSQAVLLDLVRVVAALADGQTADPKATKPKAA
jgi:hypothetical protein